MSGCSVTELERARITGLIASYRARLTPGHNDRKAIAVILAKLLSAFPAQAQSEAPAAQRVDAYFEALHGVPAWAVDEARKCIITGMAAECAGSFAPTPPQLAAVCRRMMAQDTKVIADLERILTAASEHEPDADERERVAAGFDRLRGAMDAAGKGPAEPALGAIARFEEMCRQAGVDPDSIKDQPASMRPLPTPTNG